MSLLDYLTRPAAPEEPPPPGKWVTENGQTRYLTGAEMRQRQQEQRDAIAAANARIDARQQAARDEREQRRQTHHAQTAAADEAATRRAARLEFAGTDVEFDRLWPEAWRQIQQQRLVDGETARQSQIATMARRF
jgi:hypothetical protein